MPAQACDQAHVLTALGRVCHVRATSSLFFYPGPDCGIAISQPPSARPQTPVGWHDWYLVYQVLDWREPQLL